MKLVFDRIERQSEGGYWVWFGSTKWWLPDLAVKALDHEKGEIEVDDDFARRLDLARYARKKPNN
ncbi:MAG: hypothetical protein AB1896_18825 [Thermodesulfobacteriota bacterium]